MDYLKNNFPKLENITLRIGYNQSDIQYFMKKYHSQNFDSMINLIENQLKIEKIENTKGRLSYYLLYKFIGFNVSKKQYGLNK